MRPDSESGLTAGILSRARAFFHTLKQLHDRNGQA